MRIGELSRRTDISTRMLRYYEEQGLLDAGRDDNGYRSYREPTAGRALQIRGLLDAGLTTDIIRDLLPCLDDPEGPLTPPYLSPEMAAALSEHLARIQKRIDCLSRNRDAVAAYIAAAAPDLGVLGQSVVPDGRHAAAEPFAGRGAAREAR